jgi:hypothetical protein
MTVPDPWGGLSGDALGAGERARDAAAKSELGYASTPYAPGSYGSYGSYWPYSTP